VNFTPASAGSLLAFAAILLTVLYALLLAVHVSYRSFKVTALVGVLLGAWLGIQSALVASGRMPSLPLNGLPFFFGPVLVIWIGLAFSPVGARLAATLPLAALVGFQAFRLPLELVLHAWFKQGTIPETMTWSGQNWDIVSGIVALLCAPLANRHRWAARFANIVGLALLMNVMRVAILSTPVPFGWDIEPKLLLAFHLPYALIGPVCVGGALFGHLVLTRALWGRQSSTGGPVS
jgi:ABC-type xylose transport system permease subunit